MSLQTKKINWLQQPSSNSISKSLSFTKTSCGRDEIEGSAMLLTSGNLIKQRFFSIIKVFSHLFVHTMTPSKCLLPFWDWVRVEFYYCHPVILRICHLFTGNPPSPPPLMRRRTIGLLIVMS